MSILELKNITKKFGSKVALDSIHVTLQPGKIVGLLGTNGSGKTTMIKLINDLLTPDQGTVQINGKKPGIDTKKIVKRSFRIFRNGRIWIRA